MKNRTANANRGDILLLILIVAAMYAFVPRPKADPCGACWSARVTANNVTWINGGSSDPTPPTLSTNCSNGILVDGLAYIQGSCFTGTNYNITFKSDTEVVIDPITTNGHIAYKLHDPKKIGQIQCIATISGSVSNCPGGGCIPWSVGVTGIVEVVGCNGCGSVCSGATPGTANLDNSSIDFSLNLGATSPQIAYGQLWLKEDTAFANLADPSLLQVPFTDPNVEVIPGSGAPIQQINTPQMLVNVNVINAYEYHLECFYETNVTAKVGILYGTTGSAFVTWIVKNPDGASAHNRLWITEDRGGPTRQFQYTYNITNLEWDLLEPTGQTLSTWKVPDGSNVNITNYYRQVSVGGQVFSKDVQTYQYVPALATRLLLQDVNGFGSVTQLTSYSYYTNGPASNHLQEVVYPDGNWLYYTYDGLARKVKEYSAFGNSPTPTPGVEPNPTNVNYCRMTVYDYSLTNTIDGINDDGDPNDPWSERKVTVYLPGGGDMHEVSRTYRWTVTDPQNGLESEEIERCPNPGGHYGDSSNIKTTTYYMYGTGYADGKIWSIIHPDGSSTTFSYPDIYTTTQSDPDGSTTTTIVDAFGHPQSRINIDDATSVVLSQTIYRYTNSFGALYDQLMRTHDEIDLANRTTHYTYDCCTLESMIDPDGVQTDYGYDDLKRLVTTTVYHGPGPGITTSNTLDAVGRVLSVTRFGTNSSIAPIVMKQSAYDAVGRVIAQTNALDGVTIATNVVAGGQLCVTNINPDGGTRIELHYLDGTIQYIKGTADFGVQYTNSIEQDPNTTDWRRVRTETKLDSSGSPTSEWTKSFLDGTGQDYLTLFAAVSGPYPSQQSFYNSYGELWKTVDPDGDITFRIYDDTDSDINHGQLVYTIKAMSATTRAITDYSVLVGAITSIEGDIDRITRQQRSVVQGTGGAPDVVETSTYQWTDSEKDATGTLISSNAVTTTGLTNWTIRYANASASISEQSWMQYTGTGHSMVSLAPDGSYTTNWYPYGRLASATKYDSTSMQLGQTTYSYDVHGRTYQTTDARNGATTYSYNNADQMSSVTTPNPGNGGAAETTTTYYNVMQQATNVLQADGTSVTNEYLPTGNLKKSYGSRTYPVAYTYDYAGRMKTMTNWSSFPSTGARGTTWGYDGYRGFMTNETYDGGAQGPGYAYTDGGRLWKRVWARGITTTYSYDYAGILTNVTYSDGLTSGVTNIVDRLGRVIQVGASNQVCQYQYDLAGDLLVETNTAGLLVGLAVTNGYDQYLRRTNLTARASAILSQTVYGYTNDSRLWTVSDGTNNATYSYVANSPLVSQIAFKSNSMTAMTTTKQYDLLNRLMQISNAPSASAAVSFSYSYNTANQRTKDTLVDGSYWVYQYDSLGQVTSGKKYWQDGTPVAGQQFEYGFDDIGNRKSTKSGGDETGANLRLANYTNNTLNQITGRDVPSYVDVTGIALATNTTTVNGQPAYRKGEYFRYELPIVNTNVAVWTDITVASPGQTSVTGDKYVPKAAELFYYDADGNLTNDGRWLYTWDGENRLVKMTVNTNVGPQYQLIFTYDTTGRRIQKFVSTNGIPIYTNKFLYDGWNLVAELNPVNGVIRNYIWGMDLSDSVHRSGGVGGLLEVSYKGAITTNAFAAFDGTGNVSALIDAGDGVTSANYEYGPFGEGVRSSGALGKVNRLKFSTKYEDDESDIFYYGYRYYDQSSGKWLSRDPLSEVSFQSIQDVTESDGEEFNDYLYVRNSAVNATDILGLCYEVTIKSGPGEVIGGPSDIAIHRWDRLRHNKPEHPGVQISFALTCPASTPYLVGYGLGTEAPRSPWNLDPDDNFPGGWSESKETPMLSLPPVYTITFTMPSSTYFSGPWPGLVVYGTCSCNGYKSPKRTDPPAPPKAPAPRPPATRPPYIPF